MRKTIAMVVRIGEQLVTLKLVSKSFHIGLWLTIKDDSTKNGSKFVLKQNCHQVLKRNLVLGCCGEREVIKYLTSNITIHLFPVYYIKRR